MKVKSKDATPCDAFKQAGGKPDDAIFITSFPPLYRDETLRVEQWVDVRQIDRGLDQSDDRPESNGPVYDWIEAMARDIFDKSTGNLRMVLKKVSSYSMDLTTTDYGWVISETAPKSQVHINPFKLSHRTNIPADPFCGHGSGTFRNTYIHEARHAYQNYSTTESFNGNSNDKDQDLLVNNVGIPPYNIIQDTTSDRQVCNDRTGTTLQQHFLGDDGGISSKDPYEVINNTNIGSVRYAREEDARVFADQN